VPHAGWAVLGERYMHRQQERNLAAIKALHEG
jgi:hypothetical protein